MKGKNCLITCAILLLILSPLSVFSWELGPFTRIDDANPILEPQEESVFYCPIMNIPIHWEKEHTFNPAAIVREGKVYLFYRAEDDFGTGIGHHTSRIGLATSSDGIHFERHRSPILYPKHDHQAAHEVPGGCEDPRIVETEKGSYVMTYTQWNHQIALLAVATSNNLLEWKKHGFAFEGKMERKWSKSGSIVCRLEGDRFIATKIHGKYWMYWGEGNVYAATSDDLISWDPAKDEDGNLLKVLEPREGLFDSALVEAGPPALITKDGILLLYNGKNSIDNGDPNIIPKAYSAGQVLFDLSNPTKVIDRTTNHFLTPEKPYEMNGQYSQGTVFIEGLVYFKNRWLLYYGAADSTIGVAIN